MQRFAAPTDPARQISPVAYPSFLARTAAAQAPSQGQEPVKNSSDRRKERGRPHASTRNVSPLQPERACGRRTRAAALATAFSEAVMMLPSMPTPWSVVSPPSRICT